MCYRTGGQLVCTECVLLTNVWESGSQNFTLLQATHYVNDFLSVTITIQAISNAANLAPRPTVRCCHLENIMAWFQRLWFECLLWKFHNDTYNHFPVTAFINKQTWSQSYKHHNNLQSNKYRQTKTVLHWDKVKTSVSEKPLLVEPQTALEKNATWQGSNPRLY